MYIVIAGANGFIGSFLSRRLKNMGHTVSPLARVTSNTHDNEIVTQIKGADVIINLAGAPILSRWTAAYKKQITESRILTTSGLVRAVGLLDKKPSLFISTSAVGIYDSDAENSEYNLRIANNFLASVCEEWESAAEPVTAHCRLVVFRLGVVLDATNGALKRMLPLFKMGMGGTIAGGKQGFPWIHISDVIKAFEFVISNSETSGVYNLVAPQLTNNKTFTQTLADVLHRPAIFPVPAIALKLIFGEASITLIAGQYVIPSRLLEIGFEFNYPTLISALQDLVTEK